MHYYNQVKQTNQRLIQTIHFFGVGLLLSAAWIVAYTFIQIEFGGSARVGEDILPLRHLETVLSILGFTYALYLIVAAFKRFLKQW